MSRTDTRINRIVELFDKHKPKTLVDINALGLKTRKIGNGVYRTVYKITGFPLVIKLPANDNADCKRHSVAEALTVRKINRFKKFAILKKYMPRIYYCEKSTGVMLVHFYKPVRGSEGHALASVIDDLVCTIWPYAINNGEVDIHSGNIGIDEEQSKLIDLGYFSEYGKGHE